MNRPTVLSVLAVLLGLLGLQGMMSAANASTDQFISETAQAYVDPRLVPVSEPWVAQLSDEFPLLYRMPIQEDFWIRPSVPGLSTKYPLRVFISQPDDPMVRREVQVAPKHLRVARDGAGRPRIRRNWGGGAIEVDLELGVFGQERDELVHAAATAGVTLHSVSLDTATVVPVDAGYDELRGFHGGGDSLYLEFTHTRFKEVQPDEAGLKIWETTVRFRLSGKGREVLGASFQSGQLNFPVVVKAAFPVVSFPQSPIRFWQWDWDREREFTKADDGHFLVSKSSLQLAIPGGVACLRTNFWGKARTSRNGDCANYWAD